jgi:surface polysaccharide O-acyltransferase-like enzyme
MKPLAVILDGAKEPRVRKSSDAQQPVLWTASSRSCETLEGRIGWIEMLRVVAAFAVIWLHLGAGVLLTDPPSSVQWRIADVADVAARWSVPLFIMISGALIMPKALAGRATSFYKRRFLRLGTPLIFWSGFFVVWTWWKRGEVDFRATIEAILEGRPYYHLWFLFALFGLYAAAPLCAALLAIQRPRLIWTAVGVGVLLFFLHASLSSLRGIRSDVFVNWISYVPHFMLGSLVLARRRPLWTRPMACGVFVVSVSVMAFATWALVPFVQERAWRIVSSNHNPLVIATAVSVACIAQSLSGREALLRLADRISPMMLGVYVVHPLWIEGLGAVGITPARTSLLLGLPCGTVLVFALSLGTCWILARVPLTRRLVV